MIKRSRGFTLIELIVAMTIIVLVSISAYQMLNQIVIANDRNQQVMDEQWDLFLLKNQITEDLFNIVNRPIRDQLGALEQAFVLDKRDIELAFTRGGIQIFQQKQTSLQRIAYDLDNEDLYRYYWVNLDRIEGEQPIKQKIATGIKTFSIEVYSKSYGNYTKNWKASNTEPLPAAVRVNFKTQSEEIEFTVPVLSYAIQ